jgi:hypothetical protein
MTVESEIVQIFENHSNLTMYQFLEILYNLAIQDSSWFDEFNNWCENNPYDELGAFK